MKKLITILSITAAAFMLSSCLIIGPFEEYEHGKKKTTTQTCEEEETTSTTTTQVVNTTTSSKYSILLKNNTSYAVTDWCVKKDNQVTFSNSSFNREIPAHGEDRITQLPEGYYKVFFSFEDEVQLNPWDYSSSESIYLNQNVTYCLYEKSSVVISCKGAREAAAKPQFYLEGSDGSVIDLVAE